MTEPVTPVTPVTPVVPVTPTASETSPSPKKSSITPLRIAVWVVVAGIGVFMVITGIVGMLLKAQ